VDVMVDADRWVPLGHDVEIFVRTDALTPAGYRVRFEVTLVGGLQVRCLAPLPAGFWLRPRRGPARIPGEYSTDQFRIDAREDYR
jgi:hypothetical protein